jgi:DNA-binding transcriptional MerR regulator
VTNNTNPTLFRIGEAARRAGVTTRTLRYYQEVGLLHPSGATPGGNRLYTADDVERLRRILELRDVMGFDLERIRRFLGSEDRLAQLRAEARRGTSDQRRAEMIAEAFELNHRMQTEIAEKQGVLTGVLAELRAKAVHYREIAGEIGLELEEPIEAPEYG